MNVFVLCTGRSGSKSFYHACNHITNFTVGHETNSSRLGHERLSYSNNHIEIDNRLSWFLGRLDQKYGNEAFYVHLIRNEKETAESFNRRWLGKGSIIRAYAEGILNRHSRSLGECYDYYHTVNSNIRLFLKDKRKVMTIYLNEAKQKFPEFWKAIDADGDIDRAVEEFSIQHNSSKGYHHRLFTYGIWRAKNLFR